MNIYSIKDNKMGFSTVFTAPNNFVAIRMFADTCAQPDTLFAKHAEDFELYKLGELNDETGEISPKVTYLEKALTFKDKEKTNGN